MAAIIVNEKNNGSRIDKFLAGDFFSYSRGEIAQFIKNGAVLVNNFQIKPSYILKIGDNITIDLPEKKNNLFRNKDLKISILYKDENIIVVDKAAGMQVHPSHNEKEKTIINALVENFPEIALVNDGSNFSEMRPGVVHRLDKDTSGVMLFARKQKAFDALKDSFKQRKVTKRYLALVNGIFEQKQGTICQSLAKSSDYKRQIIAHKKTKTTIREAITQYKVLREIGEYSLIEALPKTGRMHQIRVHLAFLGHPIVGDRIYGSRKFSTKDSLIGATRQMLHAHIIAGQLFGNEFSFQSDPPSDFKEVIGHIDEKIKG